MTVLMSKQTKITVNRLSEYFYNQAEASSIMKAFLSGILGSMDSRTEANAVNSLSRVVHSAVSFRSGSLLNTVLLINELSVLADTVVIPTIQRGLTAPAVETDPKNWSAMIDDLESDYWEQYFDPRYIKAA